MRAPQGTGVGNSFIPVVIVAKAKSEADKTAER
jgi:hypothetical protein